VPTWALYLDEAGDWNRHHMPVRQGETPVFTLAGVALPLEDWRAYDRSYLRLKCEFFQNEIDKSSKPAERWEFKGNRVVAPRNSDSERIRIFTYRLLDLITTFGGKIFSVSFLKNPCAPTPANSMYTISLQIISETFDIFLREQGDNIRGISILDSRVAHVQKGRGLDYTVALSLLSYIFGNEYGRQLKRLREAPLFADSAITAGIQIADIVASLMFSNTYANSLAAGGSVPEKGYLDYTHTRRYWPQISEHRFISRNTYNGYVKYGIRVFDHRNK